MTKNIQGMMKNHKLAGSIGDAGWRMFIDMLKYKSEWYGNNLLQIPTFQASTKVCGECGAVNHTLTLADREWTCGKCNSHHHRDGNAARVIKKYCITKYSGQVLSGEPVELPTMVGVMKQESNKC
jgi:putative transposase